MRYLAWLFVWLVLPITMGPTAQSFVSTDTIVLVTTDVIHRGTLFANQDTLMRAPTVYNVYHLPIAVSSMKCRELGDYYEIC